MVYFFFFFFNYLAGNFKNHFVSILYNILLHDYHDESLDEISSGKKVEVILFTRMTLVLKSTTSLLIEVILTEQTRYMDVKPGRRVKRR